MQVSGISSRTALVAVILAGGALAAPPVTARVYMTQEEALEVAFPGEVEATRKTVFLTESQMKQVEEACHEKPASELVVYYTAGGRTAYFDTHRVRTLAETVMIVVDEDSRIERVDILSFDEPEDYLPRQAWIRQLEGKQLDDELSLRKSIRPITGATLSGRALVSASRRVLAIHQVLVLSAEAGETDEEQE